MMRQRTGDAVRRFTPTRAGIVNLWDYRDEELLFVDGWLVLRGPNGSGKTKALEVLYPFVLDGRIEPRRLNPFASEERTMKANLLYRGQEVCHAYVWLELRNGDGYVTIGIGLRAHRHVDRVTRWHFVVDGRVGVDFSLLDADDRPLNRRDLIAQLGAEAVCDSPEEHRKRVDARLFGLGPARYEQLLDLVLTLRKPQLAKDLNPTELSRTLQRGLRPLDDHLLVEAAGSFDDMEAVARTLEGLVAADTATTAFLAVYSTYLRTHARAVADAVTARRRAADAQRTALAQARAALATATAEAEASRAVEEAAAGEPGRLRAHLDSLKSSEAYRSHEQLGDLERHVADLAAAASDRAETVEVERAAADRRGQEREREETGARDAQAAVGRLVVALASDAEAAGIAWTDADTDRDQLATRVNGRVSARRDDVRVVREHAGRLTEAEREHSRAAAELAGAQEAVAAGEAAERAAEVAVGDAREQVRAAIARWADDQQELLATFAPPSAPTVPTEPTEPTEPTGPGGWPELADALAEAVDRTGDPGAPTLKESYAEVTGPAVAARRDELAALASRATALADRRDEVARQREQIATERDDAPPVPATRPAPREHRPGAPLWRLVRFADGVPEAAAAGIEAALHATGLLDAWVNPEVGATATALAAGEQDGYLVPLPPGRRPAGPTLADVLVPEEQDDVPAEQVEAALASVALSQEGVPVAAIAATGAPSALPPATVTPDGRYAHGVEVGAHLKPAPEYIGATARAARRAARIAECDRTLAALDAELAEVDGARAALTSLLSAVDDAAAALPPLTPVLAALRDLDRAAATLAARRETAATAAQRLDQALAERSAAVAALRRVVAERSLPADRVDDVADAVARFEKAGLRLDAGYRAATAAAAAAEQALARHQEAAEKLAAAESAATRARRMHQEKQQAYQTLQATIGVDAKRVVAEVAEVERQITAADAALARVREELATAREACAAARARAELGERTLAEAVAEARQEARRLRPYAQRDLLGLLRCPTDLRWPTAAEEPADGELDPRVVTVHDAVLAATRELSPTETSLKQSATRLTTALTELQAQLPAAGLDHRPEWDTDDGVIVVRVADEQGLTPVAHFAERIARDRADQERLLTEAEQRVFEDALLSQIAQQIHHRTIEARDLVERMDAEMRARRMSSGLTVGVGWRLADDLDPEQREVCKLLERDPARLGPTQLATLRRHFAARIRAARAAAPEQPYRELLGQVLDYRVWRTFAFTLHRPGGRVEALTRSRHSQLSGGEQSVSLHLPLFAAANAVFGSARPDAPRLLGLDEAFAGVDEAGRGELMSLARQFDLDLFMTGYDLWATHRSVTGAAHYDLSHSALDHTVSAVLLVWDSTGDGANIADLDGTLARALGSPQTRRVPGPPAPAGPEPELALAERASRPAYEQTDGSERASRSAYERSDGFDD